MDCVYILDIIEKSNEKLEDVFKIKWETTKSYSSAHCVKRCDVVLMVNGVEHPFIIKFKDEVHIGRGNNKTETFQCPPTFAVRMHQTEVPGGPLSDLFRLIDYYNIFYTSAIKKAFTDGILC